MEKQRIGIVGSGAIGGFYGGILADAGHDVHFLLRSEYQKVAADGLYIKSHIRGDLRLPKVNAYRRAEDMPQCDWLLIGAKATSNASLAPLITSVAAPGAKVLLMQNGLGVEDGIRSLLPKDLHILGVLCWVGVHRGEVGTIHHIALGNVDIGYHSGPSTSLTAASEITASAVDLLRASGITAKAVGDLAQARWKKLVWNIPFNGLSVVLDAGTEQLVGNSDSRQLIAETMHEVIGAAAACGHALPDDLPEHMLCLTDTMADYWPSMYFDHLLSRPMELDVMYAAPLAAARQAGFLMPKVEMLHRSLRFIGEKPRVLQRSAA